MEGRREERRREKETRGDQMRRETGVDGEEGTEEGEEGRRVEMRGQQRRGKKKSRITEGREYLICDEPGYSKAPRRRRRGRGGGGGGGGGEEMKQESDGPVVLYSPVRYIGEMIRTYECFILPWDWMNT